jgi:renalase
MRIAVLGAGVAGLSCARALVDLGARVTLFDKGRSVGGRLATRREPPFAFDLGAQYFTARDPRFVEQTRRWQSDGTCARWGGRIVAVAHAGAKLEETEPLARFVGTPGMNAVGNAMATGLDIRTSHRVDLITPYAGQDEKDRKIALRGTAGEKGTTLKARAAGADAALAPLGSFDAVLVCLPSEQAASLVETASPELAAAARTVTMEPSFALGIVVAGEAAERLRALSFEGAFIGRGDAPSGSGLSWVARDSSKPGRGANEGSDAWVLHATSRWTREHFADAEADVTTAMLADFAAVFGTDAIEPSARYLRRWSFAKAGDPLDLEGDVLYDDVTRIGLAGDWTAGGKVEGAYLSGLALAARVLG